MADELTNPPTWDTGSDRASEEVGDASQDHSPRFMGLSIAFGLAAPAILSLLLFPIFLIGTGPADFPYPFSYPAWAVGITAIKFVALLRWFVVCAANPPATARTHRVGGILAGILLVGTLHGVGCGITSASMLGKAWIVDILAQVVWVSPVVYFLNFVMAAQWVIRRGGHPTRGFLIGVAIAVVPPALLQFLIFGLP